jgi:hypothetical protein
VRKDSSFLSSLAPHPSPLAPRSRGPFGTEPALPNPRPSRPEHRPIAFCVIDPRFEATPRKTVRIDRILCRPDGRTPTLPRQERAHPFPRTDPVLLTGDPEGAFASRVNSFLECGGGQIQDASTFVKAATRRKSRQRTRIQRNHGQAFRVTDAAAQEKRATLSGVGKGDWIVVYGKRGKLDDRFVSPLPVIR